QTRRFWALAILTGAAAEKTPHFSDQFLEMRLSLNSDGSIRKFDQASFGATARSVILKHYQAVLGSPRRIDPLTSPDADLEIFRQALTKDSFKEPEMQPMASAIAQALSAREVSELSRSRQMAPNPCSRDFGQLRGTGTRESGR